MKTERGEADRQIAVVAALNEPVRRALYRHVVSQGHAVGRSEAAEATGITRSLASFHLDKLVEEGLLDPEYRRTSGRTGPGAGRPSKLYRRARGEVEVSLPPRSYELAARLFAQALVGREDEPAGQALHGAANAFGTRLAAEARRLAGPGATDQSLRESAEGLLADYGFEPFQDEDGTIRLRNCPFDALASEHRQLVCGMNLSLMQGLVNGLERSGRSAALDPRPGLCCVVFRPSQESGVSSTSATPSGSAPG